MKRRSKKDSFTPINSQLGIPGTSYRIQLGFFNDTLAVRLLRGNAVIGTYVFKDDI